MLNNDVTLARKYYTFILTIKPWTRPPVHPDRCLWLRKNPAGRTFESRGGRWGRMEGYRPGGDNFIGNRILQFPRRCPPPFANECKLLWTRARRTYPLKCYTGTSVQSYIAPFALKLVGSSLSHSPRRPSACACLKPQPLDALLAYSSL